MRQITAIIQPQRLGRVRELARRLRFPGMTIDKVDGFSVPESTSDGSIRSELTEYSPKIRLVVIAEDDRAAEIAEAIGAVCRTGERGDGLVWTVPVETAMRIRDGGPVDTG